MLASAATTINSFVLLLLLLLYYNPINDAINDMEGDV